jgi:hypothetical protein
LIRFPSENLATHPPGTLLRDLSPDRNVLRFFARGVAAVFSAVSLAHALVASYVGLSTPQHANLLPPPSGFGRSMANLLKLAM